MNTTDNADRSIFDTSVPFEDWSETDTHHTPSSPIQTIATTKYLGPTDTLGSRIVVKCRNARKVVPFDYVAPKHEGIDGDKLADILPAMLDGGRGDLYLVDEVKYVTSPDENAMHWVITYRVAFKKRA